MHVYARKKGLTERKKHQRRSGTCVEFMWRKKNNRTCEKSILASFQIVRELRVQQTFQVLRKEFLGCRKTTLQHLAGPSFPVRKSVLFMKNNAD
jgi:hypothetical protein